MKTRIQRLSVFLSFLMLSLMSLNAYADSFYATVSKNHVVQNEVFQLKITTDEKASSDDIDFSVLQKNFMMGRPNFGHSVTIINGDRSAKSEWTISLAAKRTGIVTIPSFKLNGKMTQSIAIQVTKDSDAPTTNDLVEVQSHLNRTTLYPGESALLKARLIVKADTRRLQNTDIEPPKVNGMELKPASKPNQYQSVQNGMQVTVVDQDFRITAQKPGDFTLTEPKFTGSMIYGNDYDGSTRIVSLETHPKTYQMHVENKPANYHGVWLPTSKLNLSQQWKDGHGNPIQTHTFKTKVGDSISREITLKVAGVSQNQLPDIQINNPDTVRAYSEKPHFETTDNGDVVMTLKQVIIPRQKGNIELPKVSLNWWDVSAKKERTTTIDGMSLQAAASDDQPLPNVAPQPQTPAKVITKTDPGYWPYLTATFALLWMVTLALAIYWKRHGQPNAAQQPNEANAQSPSATKGSPSRSAQALTIEQAIQRRDGIAINKALNAWRHSMVLTAEDEVLLEQEKTQLDAALYARHDGTTTIDGSSLLNFIKHIERKQKKQRGRKQKGSELPPL
ncbi:BatD family protein [Vibrio nitrifigilis]|nr:BatD family protein [Vibrio nitrifigilis]